ncbi:MAG: GDP-mannose 4,6-dehydratase, partial [Thermodesulfobacteriota bacterium]
YAAVIPKFISSLLAGNAPTIYGDGDQTRDFTFVDDCNQANIKACLSKNGAGGFFNGGTGKRISINALYDMIRSNLRKDIKPIYEKARDGDVRDSLADISKAAKSFAYNPVCDIETGIKKTVDWYRDTCKS